MNLSHTAESILPRPQQHKTVAGEIAAAPLRALLVAHRTALSSATITPQHFKPAGLPQVTFGLFGGGELEKAFADVNVDLPDEVTASQGYAIVLWPDRILIGAGDAAGLRYAWTTLEQLTATDGIVEAATIFDWPDFMLRGIQFLHCMNQWGPIGVDPKLLPRYENFREQIEALPPGAEPPAAMHDLGRSYTRFDEAFALEQIAQMAQLKLNCVMLCLGDTVRWESHPEIALEDAWDLDRLRRFAEACRDHGLEIMPAFNFSAMHDTWLGKYHEIVDSPEYNRLVEDLLRECASLFPEARYIHLGMDEEDEGHRTHRGHLPSILRPTLDQLRHLSWMADVIIECGKEPVSYADILMQRDKKEWDRDAWAEEPELIETIRRKVSMMDWSTYSSRQPDHTRHVRELHDLGYRQITSSHVKSAALGRPVDVAHDLAEQMDTRRDLLGIVETVWSPIMPHDPAGPAVRAAVKMSGASFWNAHDTKGIDWGEYGRASDIEE